MHSSLKEPQKRDLRSHDFSLNHSELSTQRILPIFTLFPLILTVQLPEGVAVFDVTGKSQGFRHSEVTNSSK